MRTQTRSGFTIIEVMLFLAITGALTVALLVGSGAAIQRQRYRDSVNTFKGLIQEQYSQIANVVNSDLEHKACTEDGTTLHLNGSPQARGTSNCLIIGRFLLIEPKAVTAYNLIGLPPDVDATDDDDNTVLRSYTIGYEGEPEKYEVAWGARIVKPNSNDEVTASVLIVRSPRSGSILTYVADGDHLSSISEMITDDNTKQKDFCVDPDEELSLARHRLAVRIGERAANQSAIEIPLESDGVCGS
jgi:type II secretory pathway pseudopilin PulG